MANQPEFSLSTSSHTDKSILNIDMVKPMVAAVKITDNQYAYRGGDPAKVFIRYLLDQNDRF